MKLCNKLTTENIRCCIQISNDTASKQVYWNGEEMEGANNMEKSLFDAFWNDDGLGEHLNELFETGKLIRPNYMLEII